MSDGLDPRLPVLVGLGTASFDTEACDLMTAAVDAALDDAGGRGLGAAVDRVAVPQGSWTYPDPGRLVAERVGATEAVSHLVELGIPQQNLINDALAAVLSGASQVAVVVGGESKKWVRRRERAGLPATETSQPDVVPDVVHRRPGPLLEPVEVALRLWDPIQQYAMIDNALRAADGLDLPGQRGEIDGLWARFAQVAADNPAAAFRDDAVAASDPDWLGSPSPANRPLAFPYYKWHATQWTVDQAAALVICSVETAQRCRVPRDRWLFPRVGLESSHAVSLLCRRDLASWPAMDILGRTAEHRIGRPMSDVEVAEVYSCFPAAVRVQQRALGLARDGTPTITGGMAFAGGPFNNYVLQSVAAVGSRLRAEPDALGLVTTVSGLLTKPGLGVWSARPDPRPPLLADLALEVEAATGTVDAVETLEGYEGDATVATYTVTYRELDPHQVVAVCDTDDGRRCVAFSEDRALASGACSAELIGSRVRIRSGEFATS